MALTYYVRRIVTPYLSGVGDLTGVPVTLVELSATGEAMAVDDITGHVREQHRYAGKAAPTWVLLKGDERQFDNDLLVFLRTQARVRVAAEVTGRVVLNREGDRTPIYDHIVARVKLPFPRREWKIQLAHAFVAFGAIDERTLTEVDRELTLRGFEGRKYVDAIDEGKIARTVQYGHGWRITRPLVPEA